MNPYGKVLHHLSDGVMMMPLSGLPGTSLLVGYSQFDVCI